MDTEQTQNDAPGKQRQVSDLSMKEAYFASLSQWAEQVKAMQLMTNYMLFQYNVNFVRNSNFINQIQMQMQVQNRALYQPIHPRRRRRFNPVHVLDDAHQREIIRRYGGTQMLIAPFWKRAMAELVDSLILSIIKILLACGIAYMFGVDLESSLLSRTFKDDNPFIALFNLSLEVFSLSYDLLLIIVLIKLVVCFYECLWTMYGNGATPGKWLMKIRVVYVEAVVPLQRHVPAHFIFQTQPHPQWALLYPGETPGLMRSLLRALTKNMVMTFLFPVCIIMVLLKNNRTTYDIVTKTVVVESNPSEPQRRHH
ncbi:protein FAM8A1 [Drosophila mojavensis]|uniref:RDD domain-containing protein n=1 Tax=Drosophila mojavensis TaxID=7230 RepID=B4KG88_DROMO|nr:protein FAM8A1 [Drosophila mojavensis]EDW11075.1 uncharacterized protein Dmoj_GI15853 [Drosophila mojavensis]